jgi:putative ABC transport system permease protein
VQAAARVGRYDIELQAGGRSIDGSLIGLDRTDFPAVAFYRDDFSGEPLAALMNRLAFDQAALLVDRATWESAHLNTGDEVKVQLTYSGETYQLSFKVAGLLDYFPTLYPEDGPFFVANLEYIFESAGGLLPYDVWLRTAPGTDTDSLVRGINNFGVAVIRTQDAHTSLEQAYATPNRQGMLGLLSVGFLAASALTVIGFLLYSVFSFRERMIQLGVLRAIGLSVAQMGAALSLEQLFLILVGLGVGTGIGVLTASLYIPHLPISLGSHPGTPPYLVVIAWNDILRVYVVFGVMLLAGLAATIASLARMKIFQAVKLGEVA